jgi:hypothetical protein
MPLIRDMEAGLLDEDEVVADAGPLLETEDGPLVLVS